jgi:tripartite-type tricarboxylate transporter receptor subunit TctC
MLKKLLLAATALLVTTAAAEAAWPERPINMIVPWAAGGGTDAVARMVAAGLEKELGKPVNVINRTGGAGVVGHTEIVKARPDGYTIGLATAELVSYWWAGVAPFTYEQLTPIGLINFDASGFHVSGASEWKTLGEAIEGIRSKPAGTYKLSGIGSGAAYHLAFAGLLHSVGIDPKAVTLVPSQGAAPGFQELASGGVQFVPNALPEGKAMVESGRARALAVLSTERNPAFPDVPTVKEALGKEFVGGTWRGIVAPKGLPDEVTTTLEAALQKVANSDEFKNGMSSRGFGAAWMDKASFGTFLAEQHKSTGDTMGTLGLRTRE